MFSPVGVSNEAVVEADGIVLSSLAGGKIKIYLYVLLFSDQEYHVKT